MSQPKARRKEQWKTLTRQSILDSAIRLISRHGLQGLTMERVAADAGVSKGTLYVYFKDKEHLLDSVKEHALQPLWEEVYSILDGDLAPARKIEEMVRGHLGYFDEHRDFFRIFLLERQAAQSPLKRQQSTRYQMYLDKVASVIGDGRRRGDFKALAPGKVATMFVEAEIAMSLRRLLDPSPDPVAGDARILVEVFLRGLSKVPHAGGRAK
jgi:AcrR family transcriptional regulator